MKTLLVKTALSCFLLLFAILANSQGTISGPSQVQPGSQQNYSVSFSQWSWQFSSVSWYVSGGSVIYSDNNSCTVNWDNANGTGYITATEDWFSQSATLSVQVGSSVPNVYPQLQYAAYGSLPGLLTINYDFPPATATYQWAEWVNTSWVSIPGATQDHFQPPVITQNKRYRCQAVVDGTTYDLEAIITIPALNPGYISYPSQPVAYNTIVQGIYAGSATGGYCSSYTYTWEQSVENGPWQQIGTGLNAPSITPLQANTRLRRKVACNNEEASSNIIELKLDYVATDFENLNYVREININKKGIQSFAQADHLATGDKVQVTTYIDGWGRPIQQVQKDAVANSLNVLEDMVKHFQYDELNKEKEYLPFASSNTLGKFKLTAAIDQQNFIRSQFGQLTNSTYATTLYDESPLKEVQKQLLPGDDWGGNNVGVSIQQDYNDIGEAVHIWELPYTPNALPFTNASMIYPTGQLMKKVVTDEKGNLVITYTDGNGNTILKKVQLSNSGSNLDNQHKGWICTYYVYDDLNRLRYIITPKVVDFLNNTNNWSAFNQAMADELCYHYDYDSRGRLILKKQPGAGEVLSVYDSKDRLVMSQQAGQRRANNPSLASDQWSFVLYDDQNRKIATGLVDNNALRDDLQSDVNALSSSIRQLSIPVGNNVSQTVVVDMSVIGAAGPFLAASSGILYNSITQYDDYNYSGVKSFNANNTLAYSYSQSNIEPFAKTIRTTGMVTGEKIRVLDNSAVHFIFSTAYYDEKGRPLQNLTENILGGQDYQTSQYDFTGRPVSNFTSHNDGNGNTYTVTAKYEFDWMGRLKLLSKSFNGAPYKQLAEYSYNELGQVKTKRIAPGYTGSGASEMEIQDFEYNIQGGLTGINKNYALTANNYAQWNRFFGIYLGYTSVNNVNAAGFEPQYNGSVAATIWKSQGDNSPRNYNYTYDNAGRFTAALFTQKKRPGDGWSNADLDFTSAVQYEDANGNLKSLQHKGVIPGPSGIRIIDDLQYVYKDVVGVAGLQGNRLKTIADASNLGTNNGKLGDFVNPLATTSEYEYNKDGYLVKDPYKGIADNNNSINNNNGITYNFLNKPVKIVLQNKSVVEYTYDASGEKLSKKVTNTLTGAWTSTNYIGDFIYQADGQNNTPALQYILHEEGRIKIITPVATQNQVINAGSAGIALPGNKQGVFEYFIKDHLGSTRMVLTEEVQKEFYQATMDAANASTEEQLFGKVIVNTSPPGVTIPADNELKANRTNNNSTINLANWPGNNTDFVKLTAASPGKSMGPNLILRVMAGDQVNTSVNYYYANNNPTGGSTGLLNTIGTSLVNALLGYSGTVALAKDNIANVSSGLTSTSGALNSFISGQPGSNNTSAPKAYLNVVFLDEQFNVVPIDVVTPNTGTWFGRVTTSGATDLLTLQQKAPKNGYVFIYVNNDSDEPVYFDNLLVSHEHGRISEESHYYPYGLKIAGISSRAYSKPANRYGFQGDYSEEETETGYNEFALRNYDPQLGRWTGIDPFDEFASGYVGMGNDPVNSVDPSGGGILDLGTVGQITGSVLGDRLLAAFAGAGVGYSIDKLTGGNGELGLTIGAGIGFGVTFIPPINFGNIGSALGNIESSTPVQDANYVLHTVINSYARFAGENGYQPLYKDFFLNFVRTTVCPNCGTGSLQNRAGLYFQELFEEYIDKNFAFDNLRVVKDPANNKLPGEIRNTIPDYFGIKYSTSGKKVELTSFYELESFFELKATKNNIGVSSFDGQLRTQIQAAKRLKVREIIIVTTYGIKLTKPLQNFASENGIILTHYWAQYMVLPGNKMKLNYTPARDE